MKFRIDCKIVLFVFKAVNGLAPAYTSHLLTPSAPPRALRSSNELSPVLLWSNFKSRGYQAFSVLGPKLCNSLPLLIRLLKLH